MRSKAILMTLAMMSAALAGCTGSDGVTEIDDETLQQLFDDNIQDFMNNTSVTVNQEIHYHNNTTVNNYETTNEYNNTTSVDGGEVVNNYEENTVNNNNYSLGSSNGTSSTPLIYYVDLEFTLADLWGHNDNLPDIDHRNESVFYNNHTYYDYINNVTVSEGITIQCSVYYIVGSGSTNSSGIVTYWENNNYYDQAWDDSGFNTTMRQLFHDVAWHEDIRIACDENYDPNDGNWNSYYTEVITSFHIPQGMALQCAQDTSITSPMLWAGGNTSWQYQGSGNVMIDGMDVSCAWTVGGSEEMLVEIFDYNLRYDRNYRVTWSYILVPVIPAPLE